MIDSCKPAKGFRQSSFISVRRYANDLEEICGGSSGGFYEIINEVSENDSGECVTIVLNPRSASGLGYGMTSGSQDIVDEIKAMAGGEVRNVGPASNPEQGRSR